jgi:hypothetical protein
VPPELKTEGVCVTHFLVTAEAVCAAYRKESNPGRHNAPRRAQIESYVVESAVKLAHLGTGSARLPDETKKKILTTLLTLMILRENLERDAQCFVPRRSMAVEKPLELVAVAG